MNVNSKIDGVSVSYHPRTHSNRYCKCLSGRSQPEFKLPIRRRSQDSHDSSWPDRVLRHLSSIQSHDSWRWAS